MQSVESKNRHFGLAEICFSLKMSVGKAGMLTL